MVDYSKFDKMKDESDSDEEAAPGVHHCGSCRKKCTINTPTDKIVRALRCSRCQAAYYCSAECQKSDWKFHKRLCVDKKAKEAEEARKREEEERKKRAKEGKPDEAAASTKEPASRPRKSEDVVKIEDDEDIGDWYRHRETRLPADPNAAPRKVEGEVQPMESPSSEPRGSAWNAAGTWEEKDVTQKFCDLVKRHLNALALSDNTTTLANTTCSGEAHSCFVRGSRKLVCEVKVTVELRDGNDKKLGKVRIDEFSTVEALEPSGIRFEGRGLNEQQRSEVTTLLISKYAELVAEGCEL